MYNTFNWFEFISQAIKCWNFKNQNKYKNKKLDDANTTHTTIMKPLE